MRRCLAVLLAAAAVLSSGCSPELFGAPRDGLELAARFPHVDNLVVGHAVQVADVRVGTVSSIELDGYEAVVRILLETEHVPVGTSARIARTSLLGEDFVQLIHPEGDIRRLPGHAAGDVLPTGPPSRGLEQVTQQAIELLAAASGDDIAAVIDAGVEITDGREARISELIADVAEVTEHYAAQRAGIESTIDTLGALGGELASNREAFATLVDDVGEATELLAEQRVRMADTLRSLSDLTDAAQGSLLGDTRASFEAVLADLGPVFGAFTADPDRLPRLIDQLLLFVERFPLAVRDDELELFGLIVIGAASGAGGATYR